MVAPSCVYLSPECLPNDGSTLAIPNPDWKPVGHPDPYGVTLPFTYTDGMAVPLDDDAEAARLVAAGIVSLTPTVTPIPPGPRSKAQNFVTSYVVRGTIFNKAAVNAVVPITKYTVGQQVVLPQNETDYLTAIGMLSPTPPPA